MLTPEQQRDIDERIANRLDAEFTTRTIDAFNELTEAQREEITQSISRFMYDRQQRLRRPENTYTPRWTLGDQDINTTNYGSVYRTDQAGHLGPTLPRQIDLDSASFQGKLDADDPSILRLKGIGGGGADCMFDYLVSSCFATLSGFTEGKVYTSLSGCPFIGYSTIQGAETAIETLAAPAVVFICPGTYAENVVLGQNGSMDTQFIGGGRRNTFINPSTGNAWHFGGGLAAASNVTFQGIQFSKPFNFASGLAQTRAKFIDCDFESIIGTAGAAETRYAVGVDMLRCNVSGGITFTATAGGGTFTFETWRMVDCNVTGIVSNLGSGGGGTVTGSLQIVGGTYSGGFNLESSGSGGRIQFIGPRITGTVNGGANAIRLAESACANLIIDDATMITSTVMSGPTILLTSAGGLNANFTISCKFTGTNTNGYLGTGAGEINRGIFQGATFPVNGGASTKATATTAVFGNTTFGPNAPDLMDYSSVTTSTGGNVFYTTGTIPAGGTGVVTGPNGDPTRIIDADADTKVDVEESADEDIIRFDTAGTQRWYLGATGLANLTGFENTAFSLGGSSTNTSITLEKNAGLDLLLALVRHSATTTHSPNFNFLKSRGSAGSETTVLINHLLGEFGFYGYDGTNYIEAARVQAVVDTTPGTNDVPGALVFKTQRTGSPGAAERFRLSSNGVWIATNGRDRWPVTAKTIASDQVAIAATDTGHWTLAGEGAAADDLDGITGGTQGDILILSAVSDSVTITLKHNNAGGSSGAKLFLAGGADVTLDDINDCVMLVYKTALDSGNGGWMQVGGSGGAAGSTIAVEEGNVSVSASVSTLDFGAGFDITEAGGEAEIALDLSEINITQSIMLMAGSGVPTTTSGCASAQRVPAVTNGIDYMVLDFDATSIEYAFWNVLMPANWDAGTVTAEFIWLTTQASATATYRWGLQGLARGNADSIDTAYGTAVFVDDDATATANQVMTSDATAAITISGTPAAGDWVVFRAQRDPTHANDDGANDGRLLGIRVKYTTTGISAA